MSSYERIPSPLLSPTAFSIHTYDDETADAGLAMFLLPSSPEDDGFGPSSPTELFDFRPHPYRKKLNEAIALSRELDKASRHNRRSEAGPPVTRSFETASSRRRVKHQREIYGRLKPPNMAMQHWLDDGPATAGTEDENWLFKNAAIEPRVPYEAIPSNVKTRMTVVHPASILQNQRPLSASATSSLHRGGAVVASTTPKTTVVAATAQQPQQQRDLQVSGRRTQSRPMSASAFERDTYNPPQIYIPPSQEQQQQQKRLRQRPMSAKASTSSSATPFPSASFPPPERSKVRPVSAGILRPGRPDPVPQPPPIYSASASAAAGKSPEGDLNARKLAKSYYKSLGYSLSPSSSPVPSRSKISSLLTGEPPRVSYVVNAEAQRLAGYGRTSPAAVSAGGVLISDSMPKASAVEPRQELVDVSAAFATAEPEGEDDEEYEGGGKDGGNKSKQDGGEGDGNDMTTIQFEDNAQFLKWVSEEVDPVLKIVRLCILEQRPKNVKNFLARYFKPS